MNRDRSVVDQLNDIIDKLGSFFRLRRRHLQNCAVSLISSIDKTLAEREAELNDLSDLMDSKIKACQDDTRKSVQKLQFVLEQYQWRYNLITSLLDAGRESGQPTPFHEFLKNRFMPFANEESSVANEAELTLKMIEVDEEITQIAAFPALRSKSVGALAGAFSSGKSSFVNSMMEKTTVQLPVGLTPSTSIPTYVLHAEEMKVVGYSFKGGAFPIGPDVFNRLQKDMIKDLGFNLREYLPHLTVTVPLQNDLFSEIALVDTPGFNATDDLTGSDQTVAEKYLDLADFVIWLIGLDSDGAVSNSAVQMLRPVSEAAIPLYIVLNKADSRPPSHVKKVIESVAETLELNDISFYGICAYSAHDRVESTWEKCSLFNFISAMNKKRDQRKRMIATVEEVIKAYEEAISNDIKNSRKTVKNLEQILFSLLETNSVRANDDGSWERFTSPINEIKERLCISCLEENLQKLRELRSEMTEAINLSLK